MALHRGPRRQHQLVRGGRERGAGVDEERHHPPPVAVLGVAAGPGPGEQQLFDGGLVARFEDVEEGARLSPQPGEGLRLSRAEGAPGQSLERAHLRFEPPRPREDGGYPGRPARPPVGAGSEQVGRRERRGLPRERLDAGQRAERLRLGDAGDDRAQIRQGPAVVGERPLQQPRQPRRPALGAGEDRVSLARRARPRRHPPHRQSVLALVVERPALEIGGRRALELLQRRRDGRAHVGPVALHVVHDRRRLAQPGLGQPLHHDVERGPLLANHQHPPPLRDGRRDEVGDELRLARARRPLHAEAARAALRGVRERAVLAVVRGERLPAHRLAGAAGPHRRGPAAACAREALLHGVEIVGLLDGEQARRGPERAVAEIAREERLVVGEDGAVGPREPAEHQVRAERHRACRHGLALLRRARHEGLEREARAVGPGDAPRLQEGRDALQRRLVAGQGRVPLVAEQRRREQARAHPSHQDLRQRLVELRRAERRHRPPRLALPGHLHAHRIEQQRPPQPRALVRPALEERPAHREVAHARLQPGPPRRVRQRCHVGGEVAGALGGDDVADGDGLAFLAAERGRQPIEAGAVHGMQPQEIESARARRPGEPQRPAAQGHRDQPLPELREPQRACGRGIACSVHRARAYPEPRSAALLSAPGSRGSATTGSGSSPAG